MKNQVQILTLAEILKKDLSSDSLKRYVAENLRMVQNELKMGRSPKKYQIYVEAGNLALRQK